MDGALFSLDHAGEILTVRIDDAPVTVRLGVSEAERAEPQEIFVSVSLMIARAPGAIGADALDDTVDYDQLIAFFREDLARTPVKLLETLCDRIVAHGLSLSPSVIEVETVIKKPSVLRGKGVVSVALRRSR